MPHISVCVRKEVFASPDLSAFARVDELGLVVTGQRLEPDRAVLACRVAADDRWCRRCGCEGVSRGTVVRCLAHEPVGWRPTSLEVRVRRYRCAGCGHVWRQDTSRAARAHAKLSRGAVRWALEALVVNHLSVARVAAALKVSWNTANDAVLAEGRRLLIDDPARFEGVTAIGVDEHVWRHTPIGDKYVTVIIDLTPVRDRTGPARLLDMVPGRTKDVFETWLASRPHQWKTRVDVVAMDGFSGFRSAAASELPDATPVMDPFHVVKQAADALDTCRRRVQHAVHHHRGRKTDPLYRARKTLLTGIDILTRRQTDRLDQLFTDPRYHDVYDMWVTYQEILSSYRARTPTQGHQRMSRLITDLDTAHPLPKEALPLRKTLKQRKADILAYFTIPHTSNGPTEAINGRLEHLRGTALGFRNLTHYTTRSLLETGGFTPHLHPRL